MKALGRLIVVGAFLAPLQGAAQQPAGAAAPAPPLVLAVLNMRDLVVGKAVDGGLFRRPAQ